MIKTVSFYTLGCRLNQAEEERLRREFMEDGFFITEPESADLCIVNTCSVTNLADVKSHRAIKQLKSKNIKLKIVAVGCGANADKAYPEVELWIANLNKARTLQIIKEHYKADTLKNGKIEANTGRTRALLKIQDGCNNFCAYCIIPYLRGREVSVDLENVIKEATKLEGLGYKELVLTGVNVGKFSSNENNLTNLISALLKDTNFPRIRLSSINPQDITEEMIELWAKEPRLCNHFHLSLQSGSTSVLKRMGRPYSAQFYYSLVRKIKKRIPEIAITTDVIVGFPGETEDEFKETLGFVNKVKFAKLHVFRYSKRSGTRAESMPEQIPESIKTVRSNLLLRAGERLEKEFKNRFIGRKMEVLFEEKKACPAADGGDFWYGLTDNYIKVKYPSKQSLSNQIQEIIITKENIY